MDFKLFRTTLIMLFLFFLATAGSVDAGMVENPAAGTLAEIKKDCTLCHPSGNLKKGAAPLNKPLSSLCIECHPDRNSPTEHKVDIVPPMHVENLPLSGGKMTCITCHDPHSNKYGNMLRFQTKELCLNCHKY